MQRIRRGKTPAPPLNALAADASLQDEQYADSIYAKHYLALIQVGEDQFALVWASKKNLNKLGAHTKLIMCDGTFKTAPCCSDNSHFYQVLILHAKYRTNVLPFMMAVMTGKSRLLYDGVLLKLKEYLPDTGLKFTLLLTASCQSCFDFAHVAVAPEKVMSDYEQALQGALANIFPGALILGCWFHYSQAVFKHMMSNELAICFKESESFGVWLQLVMALPLLPTNRIEEGWSALKIYPVDVPHGYKGKFKVIRISLVFTASCELIVTSTEVSEVC